MSIRRRIDCVLALTKEKVLETHGKLKGKLENLEPQLRKASGFAFDNTSKYDFEKLLDDPPSLATNLRSYLNGFSENMREVLDKLDEHGLLFLVMEKFASSVVDLHPDKDADNIKFGSTLSNWQLGARSYDHQCANPPYGKVWKLDQAAVEAEAERGHAGRFGAGLPRISDGQLLFLQHMLSRMNPSKSELRGRSDDTLLSFLPMERIGEDGALDLEETRRLDRVAQGFTYSEMGKCSWPRPRLALKTERAGSAVGFGMASVSA